MKGECEQCSECGKNESALFSMPLVNPTGEQKDACRSECNDPEGRSNPAARDQQLQKIVMRLFDQPRHVTRLKAPERFAKSSQPRAECGEEMPRLNGSVPDLSADVGADFSRIGGKHAEDRGFSGCEGDKENPEESGAGDSDADATTAL